MMKCKKCNSEIRFASEKVGVDKQGIPIFHRIGYCDYCKTKTDIDAMQYKEIKPQNTLKPSNDFLIILATMFVIVMSLGCCGSFISCVFDDDEGISQEYTQESSAPEEQSLEDYSSIAIEEKYKQNFIDACTSCGIDTQKIEYITKIENWANGERYTFYYNDVMHSVYFIDTGEVNSINYSNNNSIKLYEDGYEPLDINDFEIDSSMYASLQIASESVVMTDLTFPGTADFLWDSTGFCTRYYNYYIIGCTFTVQNSAGYEETHHFRIDSIIIGDTSDLVYYELDGNVMTGEPCVPEIEKIPLDNSEQSDDGMIKIKEGIIGEYGKEDNFDGEMYIRYYVPSGKYTVTCDTLGSTVYIETIEFHKEDGYDTSTIIEKISFSSTKECYSIEIKEGECISLTLNSIIYLKPITE